MTDIIMFIFERMKDVYVLAASLKFNFFGYQVSVFEIMIGFSIILMIINFFRLFSDASPGGTGFMVVNHYRNENRKDKQKELTHSELSRRRRR